MRSDSQSELVMQRISFLIPISQILLPLALCLRKSDLHDLSQNSCTESGKTCSRTSHSRKTGKKVCYSGLPD